MVRTVASELGSLDVCVQAAVTVSTVATVRNTACGLLRFVDGFRDVLCLSNIAGFPPVLIMIELLSIGFSPQLSMLRPAPLVSFFAVFQRTALMTGTPGVKPSIPPQPPSLVTVRGAPDQ